MQNQTSLVTNGGGPNHLSVLAPTEDQRIRVASLKVFAWWWSQEQLRLSLDKGSANRPRSYIELKEWKDTKDPTIPHPSHIDIVTDIETGNAAGGFAVLEITADYLIAPVDYACKENIERITDEVSWSGEVRIFRTDLGNLGSSRHKKILRHFDLNALRQKFAGTAQSDSLWLWKLRLHAYVKNAAHTLAHNEAVVSLFPRDGLCTR
jgi:hypothetical protein